MFGVARISKIDIMKEVTELSLKEKLEFRKTLCTSLTPGALFVGRLLRDGQYTLSLNTELENTAIQMKQDWMKAVEYMCNTIH